MFYVRVRDDDGSLNNIEVQRLKDKLGTRAVPTAELLLDGTQAWLVNYCCLYVYYDNLLCRHLTVCSWISVLFSPG